MLKPKTDFLFIKHIGQNILFLLVLGFLFILPTSPVLSLCVRIVGFVGSALLIYFIFKKIKSMSNSLNQDAVRNSLKKMMILWVLLGIALFSGSAFAECAPSADLLKASTKSCWICGVIGKLLLGIGHLSAVVDEDMRHMALDLLGIIFLFWIVAKVFSLFFNMMAGGISDFASEFVRRFIMVMIAAVFLLSPLTEFYSLIINPVAQIASGFTMKMIDVANGNKDRADGGEETLAEQILAKELNCCYCDHSCTQEERVSMGNSGLLDTDTLDAMLCITCQSYRQVMPVIVAGQSIACDAKAKEDAGAYIIGWALTIVFMLVVLWVAFYVLDIFFRLAVVFILMPFFIAAWPFPSTRFYTKKAFDLFIFCFLQFLGLGMVLAILCALFLTILPNRGDGPITMSQLIRELQGPDPKNIYTFFAPGLNAMSPLRPLFMCLVTGLIAQKMISSSEKLISTLSGMFVPTTQIGTEAMMEVRNFTVMASSAISKIVSEIATQVNVAGIGQGITSKAKNILAAPLTPFNLPAKMGAAVALPVGFATKTAGAFLSPGLAPLTVGGGVTTYLLSSLIRKGTDTSSVPDTGVAASGEHSSPSGLNTTESASQPAEKTDKKSETVPVSTDEKGKNSAVKETKDSSAERAAPKSDDTSQTAFNKGTKKSYYKAKQQPTTESEMVLAYNEAADSAASKQSKDDTMKPDVSTAQTQIAASPVLQKSDVSSTASSTPGAAKTGASMQVASGNSSRSDHVHQQSEKFSTQREIVRSSKRVRSSKEQHDVYQGTSLVAMETISLEPPVVEQNTAKGSINYSLNPTDAQNPVVLT